MSKPTDLVQGTLDLLILRSLALEPMHGWAIAQRIRQVSGDVLQVGQGALYPALHKLEQQRLDHRGVGREREQPPREVLHADPRGPAGARGRRPRSGSACRRRSPSWCVRPDHAAVVARAPAPAAVPAPPRTPSTGSWTRSCTTTSNARSTSTSARDCACRRARRGAAVDGRARSSARRSAGTCAD